LHIYFFFLTIRSTAESPAFLTKAYKSAGTNPGVFFANYAIFTSKCKGLFFVSLNNISSRAFSSGTGSRISLSNLPLRLIAVSKLSGRELAAITNTLSDNLSKLDINSDTILRSISFDAFSLLPAIASISSIKIMEGAAF